MKSQTLHKTLNTLIALVWLANGLFCKVLNLAPRHHQIVSEILGLEHSQLTTIAIGIAEILMAVWIVSGFYPRVNAIVQIVVISIMNILEFRLVPDLLLWGELNILFAILFMGLIYWNQFILHPKALN